MGPVPGEQGPGKAVEVVERLLLECLFRSFPFRVGFRSLHVETLAECSLLHCLRWKLRQCEFRALPSSCRIR